MVHSYLQRFLKKIIIFEFFFQALVDKMRFGESYWRKGKLRSYKEQEEHHERTCELRYKDSNIHTVYCCKCCKKMQIKSSQEYLILCIPLTKYFYVWNKENKINVTCCSGHFSIKTITKNNMTQKFWEAVYLFSTPVFWSINLTYLDPDLPQTAWATVQLELGFA